VCNRFTNLVGERCGPAFHLSGFQQVSAGFVKYHAAEAVGQDHGHLPTIDVVGIEHLGCTAADLDGAGLDIPVAQIIGAIRRSVTAADAGAMFAISGEHAQTAGLMQTNVVAEGSITGSDKHLLPVSGVGATAHIKVLAMAFEKIGALEQQCSAGGQIRGLGQPLMLIDGEIP